MEDGRREMADGSWKIVDGRLEIGAGVMSKGPLRGAASRGRFAGVRGEARPRSRIVAPREFYRKAIMPRSRRAGSQDSNAAKP